jgi:hypothetical protein
MDMGGSSGTTAVLADRAKMHGAPNASPKRAGLFDSRRPKGVRKARVAQSSGDDFDLPGDGEPEPYGGYVLAGVRLAPAPDRASELALEPEPETARSADTALGSARSARSARSAAAVRATPMRSELYVLKGLFSSRTPCFRTGDTQRTRQQPSRMRCANWPVRWIGHADANGRTLVAVCGGRGTPACVLNVNARGDRTRRLSQATWRTRPTVRASGARTWSS